VAVCTASIAAAGAESAAPIDVCALPSPGDVSALRGATVDGASSDSRCVWENPDNLESVSVEFVADHRANSVQVAVLSMISDGTANDAAVDLARKIGPQIPEMTQESDPAKLRLPSRRTRFGIVIFEFD
jgi:hypothetical protein